MGRWPRFYASERPASPVVVERSPGERRRLDVVGPGREQVLATGILSSRRPEPLGVYKHLSEPFQRVQVNVLPSIPVVATEGLLVP